VRIVVEQVIFDELVMEFACGLHNFRVESRKLAKFDKIIKLNFWFLSFPIPSPNSASDANMSILDLKA